jgi:hypothetical protein
MSPNILSLPVGVAGLVLGFVSVLFTVGSSLTLGVAIGLILGVALAPWIRRAAGELEKYLGK